MNGAHDAVDADASPLRPPRARFQRWLQWLFQIGLPDEEVRAAATAGQLYDIIVRELECAYETDDDSANRSLTAVAAKRLQDAMGVLFDVPPGWLSPEAEMEQFLPARRRRQAWGELAEEMDLRMPDLEISDDVARRSGALFGWALKLLLGFIFVGLLAYLLPHNLREFLGALALCGFTGAVVLFIASAFGGPSAVPSSCRTVGDTVLFLVGENPVRLGWGRLSREEIWRILQRGLADRFDLPADKVARDLPLADALMTSELPDDAV